MSIRRARTRHFIRECNLPSSNHFIPDNREVEDTKGIFKRISRLYTDNTMAKFEKLPKDYQ